MAFLETYRWFLMVFFALATAYLIRRTSYYKFVSKHAWMDFLFTLLTALFGISPLIGFLSIFGLGKGDLFFSLSTLVIIMILCGYAVRLENKLTRSASEKEEIPQ